MPQRKMISIELNWKRANGRDVEYNIILTDKGLKVQKITRKSLLRKKGKNNKKNSVLLKIYKKTNGQEYVRVKPYAKTKLVVRKRKMRKIKNEEEGAIVEAMKNMTLNKRHTNENVEPPKKKQRTN